MITRGLLDQLLKSGQDTVAEKGRCVRARTQSGGCAAASAAAVSAACAVPGGGAAGRRGHGPAAGQQEGAQGRGQGRWSYGGLAALGVLAYKAYGNWQAQQGTRPEDRTGNPDRLPARRKSSSTARRSLKALVAAAKADGHVDARERELIEGEFTKLDNDQELQHRLHAELNKPLDPSDVARAASTPEMAAEMYIASVMLVDEESFMEKSYLDELARQLKLEPGLKAELEKQVRQASRCSLKRSQPDGSCH